MVFYRIVQFVLGVVGTVSLIACPILLAGALFAPGNTESYNGVIAGALCGVCFLLSVIGFVLIDIHGDQRRGGV